VDRQKAGTQPERTTLAVPGSRLAVVNEGLEHHAAATIARPSSLNETERATEATTTRPKVAG
jgi:hypothetical protein